MSRGMMGTGLCAVALLRISSGRRPSTQERARPTRVTSSNPAVVISPSFGPVRSMSVLSEIVVL